MLRLIDFYSRFLNWMRQLNADEGTPGQSSAVRDFTTIVGIIVTGLVSSVLSTWVAQEMLNYSFPLALVIGLVIVLLLATILQVKGLPRKPKPLKIIAFLLTLVTVQATLIAYMYISNQPPTTYLVFDATVSTIPNYPELIEKIVFTAQVQNPNGLGGLRIYGGQLSGKDGCDDTTQLVAPVKANEFEKELDQAFGKFDPKGNASLTIAVLQALKDDLKYQRGPIKIIVIASGVDPSCEPQKGGIFEEMAKDIRARTTKEITIAIIGVGDLTSTEEETLKGYARAFNGTYLNTSKTIDLTSLILASQSYLAEP